MTLDASDLFGPEDEYEALVADDCPVCGHSADDHDETGCRLCDCPGP